MKEALTTYQTKGKTDGFELLFKYDLNGNLREFKIEEGELSPKQVQWLFYSKNFPASEEQMKSLWCKDPNFKKAFSIYIAPAETSFESFWSIWGLKVKKEASEKAWSKLSENDRLKCFISVKKYQEHLSTTRQAKAHLVTWLNQKRFNDEY